MPKNIKKTKSIDKIPKKKLKKITSNKNLNV